MSFSNIISRHFFLSCILLAFILCISGNAYCAKQKNYFPTFKSTENNVIFWTKIYSEFSVNTGVLHDKNDLSVIYEAIPLMDNSLPGARRVNKAYFKASKKKYSTILKKLASGQKPSTVNEKRVYALYSPPNKRAKFKKAAKNLRIQRGLKERFIEGVSRSGGYIGEIKRIFRSYNLPEDLAYLPHVESSFNIKAYSKSGAAGIWQFTRSTGKYYMTVNSLIDERRDPIIATHAAAKYLKYSFEHLGSWPLAITAYNYGHAGMMRARKKEGSYEKIFQNYNKGRFKFASRNFYSEFIAARLVAKRLEQSKTVKLDHPKRTVKLKLQGYASLNQISRYFNINSSILQKYNPSLRKPILQGDKLIPKGFTISLPHNKKILHLAKSMPRSILNRQQKKDTLYTVKAGDTAGRIARKYRISLRQLIKANKLNNSGVVFIGQSLRIPSRAPVSSKAKIQSRSKSKPAQPKRNNIAVLKKGKKSSPSKIAKQAKHKPTTYRHLAVTSFKAKNGVHTGDIIVQPGESLGMYSHWLNIPTRKLHQLNQIVKSSSVHPGQKITLPFSKISKNNFEAKRKRFHQKNEETFFSSYKITGFKKYQVALGDTIWNICQEKFDLPLWLLKRYNNITYNQLSYNQNLKIPIVESIKDS